MDREDVEDLVHASLGRHLRVTCVLGLLFLAIGFVLGHFVAAQHARELSDRLASRADQWTAQVDERVRQFEESVKAELGEVRAMANAVREQPPIQPMVTVPPERDEQYERLLEETRRLARATEDLRKSLIARCIQETEQEKARILQELQPLVDRKMTVQAIEVSNAVNRLVDSQVSQLQSLSIVENRPTDAAGVTKPTLSDISCISNESESRICPTPVEGQLVPVAEVATPVAEELVPLMPAKSHALTRLPIEAEPSASPPRPKASADQSQFFTTPRRSRLYIQGRKPLEVSSNAEPVIR